MVGKVYLVGAGPGDPGLITLRALEVLRQAQVVVYDRLANPRLLDEAPPEAERIDVGKGPGRHRATQEEIHRILIDRAREGKRVVRLKGGDPFVFGRGGEEARALRAAGIPYEVVPGVTSAVAAPAYAGIPVTHRGLTSAFAVVTGHEDPTKEGSDLDWEALARVGTLVILMGVGRLPALVERLKAAGMDPRTPAAVVERGTTPRQRTVVATLETLVERVQAAGIRPPAVTVVGPTAALARELAWLPEARPLLGRRIVVTRSRAQASALRAGLEALGAEVIEVPTIRIEPPADPAPVDDALRDLSRWDWVVFTSVNGVEQVWARLEALGLDARAFAPVRIAAVGAATAAALADRGLRADAVPASYRTEALPDALGEAAGRRILLLRADIAPPTLARALVERGAQVTSIVAYRTVQEAIDPAVRAAVEEADALTFTSASTVRNFFAALPVPRRARIFCIGPVTAAEARAHGLRVDGVAEVHTIPGLIETVVRGLTAPTPAATVR